MPRASKRKRATMYAAIADSLRAHTKQDEVLVLAGVEHVARDLIDALDTLVQQMRATDEAYAAYVARAAHERTSEKSIRAVVRQMQAWARAVLGPAQLQAGLSVAPCRGDGNRRLKAKMVEELRATPGKMGSPGKRPRKKG